MIAIVAVDSSWAIGREGGMLYHLPLDLKHFARETRGKTLVMGRATLESLPGGKPLPGRDNIVLTRQMDYRVPGAVVLHSITELAAHIRDLPLESVMLIGGDRLYHALIDSCSQAIVTKIDAESPADSFFPNLDERDNWRLAACSEDQEENGLVFRYCTYRNLAVKPLDEYN